MTANQQRAVALARELLDGTLTPERVGDQDWELLLLASGLTGTRVQARPMAEKLLNDYSASVGYFDAQPKSDIAFRDGQPYRVPLPDMPSNMSLG